MIYKALSVVDPAGTRIRNGRKTLEIRRWIPEGLPLYDVAIVQNSIRLSANGISHDPNGLVLAIVDITHFTEWGEDQISESCASYWEPGWYAWHLANVRPIPNGVPAPAELRIYEINLPDGLCSK